jgi:hypothetical protein
VKKGALVEQALLRHLQALGDLPADLIIPPCLEPSEDSFAQVTELAATPRNPTTALRALMAGKLRDGQH